MLSQRIKWLDLLIIISFGVGLYNCETTKEVSSGCFSFQRPLEDFSTLVTNCKGKEDCIEKCLQKDSVSTKNQLILKKSDESYACYKLSNDGIDETLFAVRLFPSFCQKDTDTEELGLGPKYAKSNTNQIYCIKQKGDDNKENSVDFCTSLLSKFLRNPKLPITNEDVEVIHSCAGSDNPINEFEPSKFISAAINPNSPMKCLSYCEAFADGHNFQVNYNNYNSEDHIYGIINEPKESIVRSKSEDSHNCHCFMWKYLMNDTFADINHYYCRTCLKQNFFCGGPMIDTVSPISVYRLMRQSYSLFPLAQSTVVTKENTGQANLGLERKIEDSSDLLVQEPNTTKTIVQGEELNSKQRNQIAESEAASNEKEGKTTGIPLAASDETTTVPSEFTDSTTIFSESTFSTVDTTISSESTFSTVDTTFSSESTFSTVETEPPLVTTEETDFSSTEPTSAEPVSTTETDNVITTTLETITSQATNATTDYMKTTTDFQEVSVTETEFPEVNITSTEFPEVNITTTNYPSTINVELPTPDPTCSEGNPSGVQCKATYRGILWIACAGEPARQPCDNSPNHFSTWECTKNGKFKTNTPDFSDCSSPWIQDVENQIKEADIVNETLAKDAFNQIEKNLKNNSFYGHEIQNVFGLGGEITRKLASELTISKVIELTNQSISIFGEIIKNQLVWDEIINEKVKSETVTKFINESENSMLRLARKSSNASRPNGTYITEFELPDAFTTISGTTNEWDKSLSYPIVHSEDDSWIQLPNNWAEYFPSDEIVEFTGLQMDPLRANGIFSGYFVDNENEDQEYQNSSKVINSPILSFTFNNHNNNLTRLNGSIKSMNFTGDGVKITFQHDVNAWGKRSQNVRRKLHDGERPKAVLGSSQCVYWDMAHSIWSSEGCYLVKSERSSSICECNHLSSFALLVDVHQYIGKDPVLDILTWILCSLSIVALIICIIVFASRPVKLVRSPVSRITLNLSVCLLLGNLSFLIFVDRNLIFLSDPLCTAVGILTHYIYLCAFGWMGLEGWQLYQMVCVVFDNGKDRKILQCFLAYGVPGLIVLLTTIISLMLEDNSYGGDAYCWLNGNYIWAFLAPVALVLIANFIILVKSLQTTNNFVQSTKVAVKRERKSVMSWIKGCFSLSVLLGLTWIVGYFMLIDFSISANICAYIFVIFNASQGIFLFIFHVIMNQKIWKAIQNHIPKCGRISLFSSFESSRNKSRKTISTSLPNSNANQNNVPTLTFGSSLNRRKQQIVNYFSTKAEPRDYMPELYQTNSKKVNYLAGKLEESEA